MQSQQKGKNNLWGLAALQDRRTRSQNVLDEASPRRQKWIDRNKYYYNQVSRLLRFVIPAGRKVLMFRSDTGKILSDLTPKEGTGIEISEKIVAEAQQRYPELTHLCGFPDDTAVWPLEEKSFDFVLVSNINDTVDVLQTFKNGRRYCNPRSGRLVIYTYNALWAPLVRLAEKLKWKVAAEESNWLSEEDLRNQLVLAGFEWLKTYGIVLMPFNIPIISWLLNRVMAKLPVFGRLCFLKVMVARPIPPLLNQANVGVSVIVPCRNEAGNIADAVRRIPQMGAGTEIIFCDDKSEDGTVDEVRRMIAECPEKNIKLVHGPGICKADNVWTGFEAATKDVLMILDADLTVIPEELPLFFEALTSGVGDFINGSRLVYPMPKEAMKASNMVGNRFFSLVFSSILRQPVKDTLCGTKVFWREDWAYLKQLWGTWGIKDRWGDYELLFVEAKMNRKIIDLPVHYQERIYGTTKMTKVFKNGIRMLFMCMHGYRKLRFEY